MTYRRQGNNRDHAALKPFIKVYDAVHDLRMYMEACIIREEEQINYLYIVELSVEAIITLGQLRYNQAQVAEIDRRIAALFELLEDWSTIIE